MISSRVIESAKRIPSLIASGKIKITRHFPLEETGRQLWSELHGFAASGDLSKAKSWLADFATRIPWIGCQCRKEWRKIIALMPPDSSSRVAFARWTVGVHNAVNLTLDKPLIRFEDAVKIWHWPSEWIVADGAIRSGS